MTYHLELLTKYHSSNIITEFWLMMRTEMLIKRTYLVIIFLFKILNVSIVILGNTPIIISPHVFS